MFCPARAKECFAMPANSYYANLSFCYHGLTHGCATWKLGAQRDSAAKRLISERTCTQRQRPM